MPDDRSIADLLGVIAKQYQKRIEDERLPISQTRLEIIRRLELVTQSIKSLMRHEQNRIPWSTIAKGNPDTDQEPDR